MSRLSGINRWYVDYSTDVDPRKLRGKFPLVILDPGCKTSVAEARAAGVKILGYVAWGEIADDSRWRKKFDATGIKTLGRTKWSGDFVDLLDPAWRAMFVEEMVNEVMEDCGWDGIFCDVFDSAMDNGMSDVEAGTQAGSDAIVAVRERYPNAIIVTNRGFENFQESRQFQDAIDSMVVERVLTGEDLDWLKGEMEPVKKAGKVVLALDYCKDEEKAKKIVKKNLAMGLVPLVTATSSLSPPVLRGFPGRWA